MHMDAKSPKLSGAEHSPILIGCHWSRTGDGNGRYALACRDEQEENKRTKGMETETVGKPAPNLNVSTSAPSERSAAFRLDRP